MSVNSTATNEFLVSVFNEWDPLEEVILGRVEHAQIAAPDLGLFAIEYRQYEGPARIPSGPKSTTATTSTTGVIWIQPWHPFARD